MAKKDKKVVLESANDTLVGQQISVGDSKYNITEIEYADNDGEDQYLIYVKNRVKPILVLTDSGLSTLIGEGIITIEDNQIEIVGFVKPDESSDIELSKEDSSDDSESGIKKYLKDFIKRWDKNEDGGGDNKIHNKLVNEYQTYSENHNLKKMSADDLLSLIEEKGLDSARFEKSNSKYPSNQFNYNIPDYKYYIVAGVNGKIVEGFEYKEDAKERLKEYPSSINGVIQSKKSLTVDPDDDLNWGNPMVVNDDVIERAKKYYSHYVNEEVADFFNVVDLPFPENGMQELPIGTKCLLELYGDCLLKKMEHASKYGLKKSKDALLKEYTKVNEILSQV